MVKHSVLTVLISGAATLTEPSNAFAADILQMICYESEQQGRVGADKGDRFFIVIQNSGTGIDGSYLLENLYPLERDQVYSSAQVNVYEGLGKDVRDGRLNVSDFKEDMATQIHEGKLTVELGQLIVSEGTKSSANGFALAANIDASTSMGADGIGVYREFYIFSNPYWDINCEQPVILQELTCSPEKSSF